jgi:aminoglycoside/choline kinase family phosphotransferase
LHGLILEEDLGTVTLKDYYFKNESNLEAIENTYKNVLDALLKWQKLDLSVSQSISSRAMDYDTFMWETDYFARFCVKDFCACEKVLNKNWEKEREQMALAASSLPRSCIHRDFQSENVMVHNGKIRFVDYQGARLGPAHYDVASLLFDPYIPTLSFGLVTSLYAYYKSISKTDNNEHTFYLCAAQRLMQALGAYGNLSLHKGKTWYKEFITLALNRLVHVLSFLPDYPYMGMVAQECQLVLKQIEIEKKSASSFLI